MMSHSQQPMTNPAVIALAKKHLRQRVSPFGSDFDDRQVGGSPTAADEPTDDEPA